LIVYRFNLFYKIRDGLIVQLRKVG
jgi:hypothetical protein